MRWGCYLTKRVRMSAIARAFDGASAPGGWFASVALGPIGGVCNRDGGGIAGGFHLVRP